MVERVLGLDPGSRITGYGLVQCTNDRFECIEAGAIALNQADFPSRLAELQTQLEAIYRRLEPQIVVVERIFLGKNVDSAFKLGHARGICLALAQRGQAQVFEYAARKVKKVITGSGDAAKETVAMMVMRQLNLKNKVAVDASDALALALAHFSLKNEREIQQRLESRL